MIDNAQTQLAYTSIASTPHGKTGFRMVDPGNIVACSRPNRHRRDCEAPADLGRLHRAGKRIDVDQQGARGRQPYRWTLSAPMARGFFRMAIWR